MTGDVRARLCAVMRYEGDDWLERAEHLLDVAWKREQRRKTCDISTVGGRLKAARQAMGLSQRQVELRLDIPSVRISDYERGRRDLDAQTFTRLAMVFRPVTTRAWLLMETDEGAPNVPVEVLGKQHKEGYRWLRKRRAWGKAKTEAEARNAARRARAEAEAQKR